MAKLPNADRAKIDPRKIVDYLLDDSHSIGGPKARFFSDFGFRRNAPHMLADALMLHAQVLDVLSLQSSPHGMKYVIEGPLPAPDRRTPVVKAVWTIDAGDDVPRFVTAMPGRRKRP